MNDERKIKILEALKKGEQQELKNLNMSVEEINELLKDIDDKIQEKDEIIEKIGKLSEQINYIEKSINYTFPNDYKEYILNLKPLKIKNNLFKTKNGYEKVLRYLNSFEADSKTYILEAQQFDSKYKLELVPFGLLEFGDLICFDRRTNDIVIYNHELDEIEIKANSFNEFLKMLY